MRPCYYVFQDVACILSPCGAFIEKPPAIAGGCLLKTYEMVAFQNLKEFCEPFIQWLCLFSKFSFQQFTKLYNIFFAVYKRPNKTACSIKVYIGEPGLAKKLLCYPVENTGVFNFKRNDVNIVFCPLNIM